MKSNVEFRNLAWKCLWADHWFGRLFGGGLLLGLCGYAVQVVLSGILGWLHVQSWLDYLGAVVQNRQDLTTPIPNLTHEFISQACSSMVLTMFFSFIMAGIASYGCAVILKRCLANDENGWLGAAFGGFRDPFGMLWLQLRYWLICLLYGFVAVIVPGVLCVCGYPLVKDLSLLQLAAGVGVGTALSLCWATWIFCIPFYRYRFLWLVKAEHSEWSAGECIRSCRALMKGHMMESFRLDCSYWKPITFVLVVVLLMAGGFVSALFIESPFVKLTLTLLLHLGFCVALVASIILGQYISVGQGFFYQDLKDEETTVADILI